MLGNVELYEAIDRMGDEIKRRDAENAKLRERITTQKQTIQSYRDESREWREAAEHAQAENAKLRELVKDLNKWLWNGADCTECPFTAKCDLNAAFESDLRSNICIGLSEIHDRMRELGIEVEG